MWGKLVTGLHGIAVAWPSASALTRARRRVGAKPLRALFEAVSGPVAAPGMVGVFWRGLRMVAIDATSLHVPDSPAMTTRYRKRHGDRLEWGYPLLRLTVLIECGTRALIGAVFGPEADGETVYAVRLLDKLTAGMLLLADAGYDSWRLLADVTATGAQYVCRSGAARTPLILRVLPDGSYLSVLGYGRVTVRIVEAWITVTYADGTAHTQQWRLITSLLQPGRYPAADLISLYHERWQVETTYLSIKHTILDGRVLRSQHPADIDQEVYALLTVYQAIVRIACDAVASRPGLDPDRASFTVALETARDQVIAAAGILPPAGRTVLVGVIGHVLLDSLLPARRRQRIKALPAFLAQRVGHAVEENLLMGEVEVPVQWVRFAQCICAEIAYHAVNLVGADVVPFRCRVFHRRPLRFASPMPGNDARSGGSPSEASIAAPEGQHRPPPATCPQP